MKSIFQITALSIFSFISIQHVKAQSSIRGIIKDANEKPIEYATVLLLKASDSSLVKGAMSGASGIYSFKNTSKGTYLISSTFTGMTQAWSKVFNIMDGKNEINAETLTLRNADAVLENVKVTAKVPLYEQKVDRMVINVKNSITDAGGTALDVLEKSPGIVVNRQNNSISVNGKNGVVIMINGKITYMPIEAVMQMLAGINASNIEKIEIITTPPAKYDAEGNAGYINIVLINNPYSGFNGAYYITAGYGQREKPEAGFNFNYRSGKINIYGNYSFTWIHYLQQIENLRQINKTNDTTISNSFSHRNGIMKTHNLLLGADYQLDSSTVVGIMINGFNSHWQMTANNGATISSHNTIDTSIDVVDNEVNHWQNIMVNANMHHKFKNNGELDADANYIYYKDDNPNAYANNYYDGSKSFLFLQNKQSGKITPINFKVFSSDYSKQLTKKINMEAGVKLSVSQFTNNVSVQNLVEQHWIADSNFTASYLLKENIAAAYTSFTGNLSSKTMVKAGLRYEYTTSHLTSNEAGTIVNRKYGELFPTFYISQKKDDNNSFNFSYARRITRPTYNDLAPFTIFWDPKTFFTGNPALQPAIANTVQVSYVHKNKIFSVSYTTENNTIESFQNTVDTMNNTQYMSAYNFHKVQYAAVSLALPFRLNKWWSMQNNFIGNWTKINTTWYNAPLSLSLLFYNINTTQSFTLPKDFTIELTGYYYSASYFGTQKYKGIYQVDFGAQKKFKNKKDNLRVAFRDMFNSSTNWYGTESEPDKGILIHTHYNFGLMDYSITYTHNFGNTSLKEKRNRSTGAEDETSRVHN